MTRDLSNLITEKIQGKAYLATGDAYLSTRQFPGDGRDAEEGEKYVQEWEMRAVSQDGNAVTIVYQFPQIWATTEDLEGWIPDDEHPWDDEEYVVKIQIDRGEDELDNHEKAVFSELQKRIRERKTGEETLKGF